MQPGYLPVLDGVRAVAVLCVLAYHGGLPVPGDLGVTVFFVLSGFLITRMLLQEAKSGGRVDLPTFYLRRSLRIFPAYYAFLAVSFVWDQLAGAPWSPRLTVAALGYVMNYHTAFAGNVGGLAHTWSLAVEEQFYLCWPPALVLLLGRGLDRAQVTVGAVILSVAAWRSALYLSGTVGTAYVYNAFDTRADCLLIGCLLALLLARQATAARLAAWQPPAALPLLTLGLLLLSRLGGGARYHYLVGFTVDALLVGALLLQLLGRELPAGWGVLRSVPLRSVGRLSYSLYLWHLLGFGVGRHVPGPEWAQAGAGALAAFALAAGSYLMVERPMLRLKARLGRPLATVAVGPAPPGKL